MKAVAPCSALSVERPAILKAASTAQSLRKRECWDRLQFTDRRDETVTQPGTTHHHDRLHLVGQPAELFAVKRCPLGAELLDQRTAREAGDGSFESLNFRIMVLNRCFGWRLIGVFGGVLGSIGHADCSGLRGPRRWRAGGVW
jgi:hypothetical protein